MKQFEYIEIKQMPKRADGLASTYYRMSYQEKQRLKTWIDTIVDEIIEVCSRDGEWLDFVTAPLEIKGPMGFAKRTRGQYYSIYEIIKDLKSRLDQGQDPLDSMLGPNGRWNRLFGGTDYAIDLIDHTEVEHNEFGSLFSPWAGASS